MDSDTLAKLKVECIVLRYPDADCKFMKDQGYQDEVDLIVRDERRNKFIVDLTKHLTGNTLVLFQFVEKHGDVLHTMINNSLTDRKVFYVWGGTDTETRRRYVQLQRMRRAQLLLHLMVRFLLVLIFVIFITSCSLHRPKVELESCNPWVVRCDLVTIKTQDW